MGAAGPAIGLQAAGTAVGAYGSYTEGVAQKDYYNALAVNSRRKADSVRLRGDAESHAAQDKGSYESKLARKKESELVGSQKVALAANIGAGSVTAADITKDTFDKARLDQLAIKYNADLKSWAAKSKAAMDAYDLEEAARGYERAGKAAKQAGKQNAFNSLLSGSGQVASTWYTANRYRAS